MFNPKRKKKKERKFNPCNKAKQIKYQQIQEDVGGVSVLLRLKKKKFLEFIREKETTWRLGSVNLISGLNGYLRRGSSEFSRRVSHIEEFKHACKSGMHAGSETAALVIPNPLILMQPFWENSPKTLLLPQAASSLEGAELSKVLQHGPQLQWEGRILGRGAEKLWGWQPLWGFPQSSSQNGIRGNRAASLQMSPLAIPILKNYELI